MAILNGIEGLAHVIVESDGLNWTGYIFVDPDPTNIRYFPIVGPASKESVYEGPILLDGKYYFVNGKVHIRNVNYTHEPEEFRVDFKGIQPINIVKIFEAKPDDFLA